MSTNIDGSQSNFLPTMLLPIRLYPAKYHFMPAQGQIQEVEIFCVARHGYIRIWVYYVLKLVHRQNHPIFILKMISYTKFELVTFNTSSIKSAEKPRYTNEEVHKYFRAPLHALEFS